MMKIWLSLLGAFLFTNITAQINLTNGLYICYPLDGNANDFSGNLHHATNFGSTPTADRFGNLNGAMDFNGVNNYLSINNSFPDMSRFSISVWVNHTKITYPSCILSDADYTPYYDVFFNISDDGLGIDANKTGGSINQMDAYPLGNYSPIITGQQLNNSWHHLVWICDSSSQQVYIDTFLMASVNVPGTNIGYHNANPSIGRLGDGVTNGAGYFQYFMGKIDEFRLYSRALNFSEVKALYTEQISCDAKTGLNVLGSFNRFNVFPNPFNSEITFRTDTYLSNAVVDIYNSLGERVKSFSFSGNEIKIDMLFYSDGIYTYKVVEKGILISTGKLVAQ